LFYPIFHPAQKLTPGNAISYLLQHVWINFSQVSMIRRALFLLCVLGCLGHWRDVSAGEISNPRKIRAAITSISGSMVPPI
jgi:hypothetical protein